jgi:hypothetical protein
MNNTTTKRDLSILAIFMAATLVVLPGTLSVTSTQSAFAYKKGRDGHKGNGNTVTIQKNKKAGTQSGFDNLFEQEVILQHF